MGLETLTGKNNLSIREVMKKINQNTKGVLFILNEEDRLVGVVSDGDLRRALLNDVPMDAGIQQILNKNFIFATADESLEDLRLKINDKITIIPIVDEKLKLVDYFEAYHEVHFPVTNPSLGGNELKYLTDAFLSSWISSTGEYITRFEKGFSSFCDVKYGVATSNGTTALHLALVALGIGPGDEVIVPDLTFAATVNSVLYTGATPVIVDVEKDDWCISVEKIKKFINKKTKAIIPVHLYGHPADMEAISKIAKEHNLFVIEDCAEAHGAEINGKKVGSFSDISCFSFYGNKIITTGEGGMCLTNSEKLDLKMRVLRDHGMSKERRYYHETVGFNYRMTNLQASIGCAQLERIEEILKSREQCEKLYQDVFSKNTSLVFQKNKNQSFKKVVWLVSAIFTSGERDQFIEKLKNIKIDVRPFFIPMSEMDIYKKYVPEACPNSLSLSKAGINLPTYVDSVHMQKILARIREI